MDAHRVEFPIVKAATVYEQVCAVLTSLFNVRWTSGGRGLQGFRPLCYHRLGMAVLTKSEIHNETCAGQCYLINSC